MSDDFESFLKDAVRQGFFFHQTKENSDQAKVIVVATEIEEVLQKHKANNGETMMALGSVLGLHAATTAENEEDMAIRVAAITEVFGTLAGQHWKHKKDRSA